MNPFTTLKAGMSVGVCRKVASNQSRIREQDIGRVFKVTGWDCLGRQHNRYIACVYLDDGKGYKTRAVIPELATINPNFEPEGEFVVCVGCGATVSEDNLRTRPRLRNIKACPACGMLEPHES